MKRNKLIIFLIFISFISCDNWNKDSYPIVEKRFKIIQDSFSDAMLIRTSDNDILVSGHILFYSSNSDFIITDEKPRDSITGMKSLKYDEYNNIFEKSNFLQYWIIVLKNDSAFGPYKKAEYLVMRNKLGVPDSLKLNCSTKCFYLKGQRNDVCYEHPDSDVVDIKNLKGNKYAKIFFN